jgi:hypothetical protein
MEIIRSLHHKKIQFYGCKQVFYFDKSRKVPLGKFPPEIFCVRGKFSPGTFSENPPEIREDVGQFRTTFSKKFL